MLNIHVYVLDEDVEHTMNWIYQLIRGSHTAIGEGFTKIAHDLQAGDACSDKIVLQLISYVLDGLIYNKWPGGCDNTTAAE